jgi:uncharacterized protein
MTSQFNYEVTSDDKLWALLAYVLTPIVPIIILLIEEKRNRPFLREHNVQALVWGVLTIIVGTLLSFLLCIPYLLMWALAVYWGIQAYNGKSVNIPVLTDFLKKQGWA